MPKGWEDLVVPDDLKLSADQKQFLIIDEWLSGRNKKILGFSSPSGIQTKKAA